MASREQLERYKTLSRMRSKVLRYICQGLSYAQIAERIVTTEGNVRKTLHDAYAHLDLLSYDTDERVEILHEVYCPLFDQDLSDLEVTSEEEQDYETSLALVPLSAEEEERMSADEQALVRYVQQKPQKRKPSAGGGCRRVLVRGLLLLLLVLALGAGAIYAWEWIRPSLMGQAQVAAATETKATTPTQSSEQAALQTLNASGQTAPQLAASATPEPSSTAAPTTAATNTARPSPTVDFGPIYELGEWHQEGDVWYRLFDYELKRNGVFFILEVWNRSNEDVLFHWSTAQNTFLRDNAGNEYELDAKYEFDSFDENIPAQSKELILHLSPNTVGFNAAPLYQPGVTEAYLTLEYFSRIERATWVIYIAK